MTVTVSRRDSHNPPEQGCLLRPVSVLLLGGCSPSLQMSPRASYCPEARGHCRQPKSSGCPAPLCTQPLLYCSWAPGSGAFGCALGPPWLWALGVLPSPVGSLGPPLGCAFGLDASWLLVTTRRGTIKPESPRSPHLPSGPQRLPLTGILRPRLIACPTPGRAWGPRCTSPILKAAQLDPGQPQA